MSDDPFDFLREGYEPDDPLDFLAAQSAPALTSHRGFERPARRSASADLPRGTTRARSGFLTGGIGGFFYGCVVGTMAISIGSLCLLTVVLFPVGLLLIVGGALAPLVCLLRGLSRIKGRCPYCDSRISGYAGDRGVTCPACQRRAVIRGRAFARID